MISINGGMVLVVNAQSMAFMGVKIYPTLRSGASHTTQEHVLLFQRHMRVYSSSVLNDSEKVFDELSNSWI